MRTRLRVHRQQDEDALRATPGRAAPGQAPPATAPLVSLQRTLGNAAFQRYLQRETGSPGRSDAVQREPDQPGKQADAAPGSQSITLLKIKTADGKEVRGPGKRKGHEGAFELLGFSNDTVRSPANVVGRRPPATRIRTPSISRAGRERPQRSWRNSRSSRRWTRRLPCFCSIP